MSHVSVRVFTFNESAELYSGLFALETFLLQSEPDIIIICTQETREKGNGTTVQDLVSQMLESRSRYWASARNRVRANSSRFYEKAKNVGMSIWMSRKRFILLTGSTAVGPNCTKSASESVSGCLLVAPPRHDFNKGEDYSSPYTLSLKFNDGTEKIAELKVRMNLFRFSERSKSAILTTLEVSVMNADRTLQPRLALAVVGTHLYFQGQESQTGFNQRAYDLRRIVSVFNLPTLNQTHNLILCGDLNMRNDPTAYRSRLQGPVANDCLASTKSEVEAKKCSAAVLNRYLVDDHASIEAMNELVHFFTGNYGNESEHRLFASLLNSVYLDFPTCSLQRGSTRSQVIGTDHRRFPYDQFNPWENGRRSIPSSCAQILFSPAQNSSPKDFVRTNIQPLSVDDMIRSTNLALVANFMVSLRPLAVRRPSRPPAPPLPQR
jgi:hypothetical protein